MRILLLIVLICNVSSLILSLIILYLYDKQTKEHERKINKIRKVCEDNIYEDLDDMKMMCILADIVSICNRGRTIYNEEDDKHR
jgi:Na+-transporting NADH:ubiquinone oxidoreductase subunit NqrC